MVLTRACGTVRALSLKQNEFGAKLLLRRPSSTRGHPPRTVVEEPKKLIIVQAGEFPASPLSSHVRRTRNTDPLCGVQNLKMSPDSPSPKSRGDDILLKARYASGNRLKYLVQILGGVGFQGDLFRKKHLSLPTTYAVICSGLAVVRPPH